MGFFSILFGNPDDDCIRLNAVPEERQQQYNEDYLAEVMQHKDVRDALKYDPSLSQEERKAVYKIDRAYKGIKTESYKEWEERYSQECEEDIARRKQQRKDRKQLAEAMSEVQESESRGWFWWF